MTFDLSRLARVFAGAMIVGALAASSLLTDTATIARGELPPNRQSLGLIYDGLRRAEVGHPCRSDLVLEDDTCTHGPDPAPPGLDIAQDIPPVSETLQREAAQAEQAVICDGNGVAGKRVQVIYARASDRTDRFAQYVGSIRTWSSQMDDMFYLSAQQTNGNVRVRFVTNTSCVITVANVVLSTTADDYFGNTISQLRAAGYNRTDRKYLIFMDANIYCGIAQVANDDRVGTNNAHNSGPMYARVDAGCWGARVAAHELMHTLGAVQDSAPNTTLGLGGSDGGHCTDEYDIMCYSDAGRGQPPMNYLCPQANESRFDCNNDDYFHTNPPTGSYLATHWNAAKNAFLIQNAVTSTPAPPTSTPGPTMTPTATSTPVPTLNPLNIRGWIYLPLTVRD